jgi:hypothetical protein
MTAAAAIVVIVTIRRKGLPAQRMVGVYPSTTDAVVHAIETAGADAGPLSITAKVPQP